jgi:hypothetical protein
MQMQVGKGFFKGQLGRRIRLGEGLGGRLWQSEEPLVVGDYHFWKGRLPDKRLDSLGPIVGIPYENWPETRATIANMLNGEKIHLFETKRLTKDGRILPVQLSSTNFS